MGDGGLVRCELVFLEMVNDVNDELFLGLI